METSQRDKKFDLEERTFRFASGVRALLKSLPANTAAPDDRSQLSRSSGSVAANYIEANESLSSKDFVMRIKICRKEARESQLWLKLLLDQVDAQFHADIQTFADEAHQLVKIFNSIVFKFKDS
jgi:four helix bundle protein